MLYTSPIEASQTLMALINNMLDLATIEAGYMQLEPARVDVHELLDATAAMMRQRAHSRSLTLALDCPAGISRAVWDEHRIKHALLNLLSNAVTYTDPGGRVELSARRTGAHISIKVTDTGIGMPKADQERVFGRFVRGTGEARAGVGLGLSLVRSFIELHGGVVSLTSVPNQGTTVTCLLPAEAAPELLQAVAD